MQPLFIDESQLARGMRGPARPNTQHAHREEWRDHVQRLDTFVSPQHAAATMATPSPPPRLQAWPELISLVPTIESVFVRQRRNCVASGIWESATGRLIAYDAPFAALFDLACNPALCTSAGVRWSEFAELSVAALQHLPALVLSIQETIARISAFSAQMVCHVDELHGVHFITKLGRIMVRTPPCPDFDRPHTVPAVQTCSVRILLAQSHLYPNEVFVVWFVDQVSVYPILLPQLLSMRCDQSAATLQPQMRR